MSSQNSQNLTQQLFSKFQLLNSTPPSASTNEILKIVDPILDSRYFPSPKFTNVLTITIGRLFNAVASEKASRSDFINILNKLNAFTKSTMNNQHFHTAMYEFFKILKYSVSVTEGISKTVSFGSESSFNFESSSIGIVLKKNKFLKSILYRKNEKSLFKTTLFPLTMNFSFEN